VCRVVLQIRCMCVSDEKFQICEACSVLATSVSRSLERVERCTWEGVASRFSSEREECVCTSDDQNQSRRSLSNQ
jgi:hypothetical protein